MVERPALEAVLLDAGGTLGRLDFEWMADCVTSLGHAVDADTLRTAELVGRRCYDLSAGIGHGESPPLGAAGNIHDYFGGMLEAAGVPRDLIDRALPAFMAQQAGPGLWARRMEGAIQALDGLHALGLRRAVVSNSDGRAEWHLREWGVLEHLEFVIDSHLVQIEKPDPRIFHIALDRLRVPAARTLYVGDIRCVDEVGARAAGLHFVLIDPTGRYVGDDGHHIRRIIDLPGWIEQHFEVPAPRKWVVGSPSSRPDTQEDT